MSNPLRWGILGTGNIAKQFAAGLSTAKLGKLTAVGSRTPQAAGGFANQFAIPAQGDYDALINNKEVDAIYLSAPNSLHHEWTIKALRAGKHVLCEKPFAMDAEQAQEMFDVAKSAGRVLIEAFMYRTHPYVKAIDDAIRSGVIGKVQMIRTNFCFRVTKTEGNVRFVRELGGGALMDVGCYCLNFSRHFAGAEPTEIHASAKFHSSGVDDITSGTLKFSNDVLASFTCGMSVQADNTASICGTDGYLEIAWPWKPQPGKGGYVICRGIPPRQDQTNPASGKSAAALPPRQHVPIDVDQDLYGLEADVFAATVLNGAPPFVTAADTLGNMKTLDAIRSQIGLKF